MSEPHRHRDTPTDTTTTALMAAMDCKVSSDVGECPSCGSAPCGPHGEYWYCETHDWHEDDNSEGVCGYALMLSRAIAAVLAPVVATARAEALTEAADAVRDCRENGLPAGYTSHPYHQGVEKWLRDRAARITRDDQP